MPEILLHYIWQRGLFLAFPQQTTDGRPIEVLSVGRHNLDAGPDFTDVHLRIGGQEWVGNIEIHISSTDWYRHRHHLDHAYDNVILHVVRHADREVLTSMGQPLTQCELVYRDDEDYVAGLIEEAVRMDSPLMSHRCGTWLREQPELLQRGWRDALLLRRLQCKTDSILRLLEIVHGNWQEAFYISLSRNFGFHTNSLPFEQLAIATPLPCLLKHRNSLFQLTAILLGQSGLLGEEINGESTRTREWTFEEAMLWKEYLFLRTKFSLRPLQPSVWKRARMHPQNCPETRIRQFAQLLYQSEFLFSALMEADSIDEMVRLLTLRPDAVDQDSRVAPPPSLGRSSIEILLINTVLPYLYAKGHKEAALHWMRLLPAENNTIIRQWRALGQSIHSAADTQALIHLYQNYCQNQLCVQCDVGWQIFLNHS